MYHLFGGFAVSALYCVGTAVVVWLNEPAALHSYVGAYVSSFNCLVSGGLIIAAALFVMDTKSSVPKIIENSFGEANLRKTDYCKYKQGYLSVFGAAVFSSLYIIVAFFIFYYCKFPMSGWSEIFLISIACIEYGLGVYVGRKLYFIGRMMDAITDVQLSKRVYRSGEINNIVSYVNILSTLCVIFVYVHVRSFYNAPFVFASPFGHSLRILLLLPALIATPVLVIFNFYPRIVLRKIFSRDFERDISKSKKMLASHQLSEVEKLAYLIEYERASREDIKSKLQLSLSDLPMGVTIIFMLIGVLVKM
jgi:hypothetical protein